MVIVRDQRLGEITSSGIGDVEDESDIGFTAQHNGLALEMILLLCRPRLG